MPPAGEPNLPDRLHARSEFLLYQTEDGRTRLEVRLVGDTVWLSLNQIADLFQRDKSVIFRHIRNIFEEGELQRDSVVANFATTAADGKTYQVEYFNLDVIISVGYRVHSHRGTQFRIWATQRLREYIIKGFTLDDERLKRAGGGNYFDELLARIRDIRSSEKLFWRKVLDIYATSIDYDPNTDLSHDFFATVQNKMDGFGDTLFNSGVPPRQNRRASPVWGDGIKPPVRLCEPGDQDGQRGSLVSPDPSPRRGAAER